MKKIALMGLMALALAAILLPLSACKKESGSAKDAGRAFVGVEWVFSKPAGVHLAKTETTVEQYHKCVEAGKCAWPKANDEDKDCNWGYGDRDDHPINCVDWEQAKAFCAWAGGRLPSEEEWYAEASNGGSRDFPWGDVKATCDYAILPKPREGNGCGRESTWPMCSKTAGNSVSGLCDMSGNVSEWMTSTETYKTPSKVEEHINRGGWWGNKANPRIRAKTPWSTRGGWLGFRCAKTPQ